MIEFGFGEKHFESPKQQQQQPSHRRQWPVGPPPSRTIGRRGVALAPPSRGAFSQFQLPRGVVPNSWPIPPPLNTRRGEGGKFDSHITLQLVFLDGEEAFHEWTHLDSIYGARHLAGMLERKWYPSTDGSAFELSREIDRIDVFMLLDLLGAKNPRLQSTFGHGTTALFEQLPFIEEQLAKMNLLNRIPRIFYYGTSYGAVEDDHIAFMRKGVPVLHLISVPFPPFWHTPGDNESILDNATIENLASILRVFVARYLGIHPPLIGR
uniref:glutaminyl-peptide cyclotransferase n=1 Tax=Globodera pallida TaxID=36090 RepID=A0A183C1M4_GLOPA